MSEPLTVEDAAIDWALRHARGDMSFADIEAFAAWLGESEAHGTAFDDAMAAWQMLETPRLEPEILPFRCEALKALQSAQRRRWSGFPAWRVAAAAGLVLALAGGLYGWMAPRHYETGIGERRVVALSDGSRLTLDAQTSVDVDYSSHARRLTLDNGRATFTVAKDPLRPFSVASLGRMVVATGTEFSVERFGQDLRVVLYKGHVAVLRKIGDRMVPDVLDHGAQADNALTPGRELVMPGGAGGAQIRDLPDPAAEKAWEAGQIDVADEPLGVVAARMNRYLNGPRLEVAPDAAGVRISGLFNAGDMEAFISGVTGLFPVVAQRQADGSFRLQRQTSSTHSKS